MKNISIIIPVYNASKWLDFCLTPLIAQKGIEDNELILIDDCSSDNSADIIKSYAEKYPFITPAYNEFNKGCAETRNHGLRIADESEFTIFCDSDDQMAIPKDFAKKIAGGGILNIAKTEYPIDTLYLKKMESVARDLRADISFGEMTSICYDQNVSTEGNHIFFEKSGLCDTQMDAQILGAQRDSANAALYRTDFIFSKNLYFEPELRNDEDRIFNRRAILYARKIAYVSDAVYLYNIRPDSICGYARNQQPLDDLDSDVLKREMIMHWYILNEEWPKEIAQMFANSDLAAWNLLCPLKDEYIKRGYVENFGDYKYCTNEICRTCRYLQNNANKSLVNEILTDICPSFLQRRKKFPHYR